MYLGKYYIINIGFISKTLKIMLVIYDSLNTLIFMIHVPVKVNFSYGDYLISVYTVLLLRKYIYNVCV